MNLGSQKTTKKSQAVLEVEEVKYSQINDSYVQSSVMDFDLTKAGRSPTGAKRAVQSNVFATQKTQRKREMMMAKMVA